MTVVGLVAEGEDPWTLPPAWDGPAGPGAHELYAVLAAAAAAGERAELRGPVDRRLLARTGAAVDLPATARIPEAADVVVVLARERDPLFRARRLLSPAQAVLLAGGGERDGSGERAALEAAGFAVWAAAEVADAAGVRAALGRLADDPGRPARGEIGRLLADERLGLLGLVNEARAQAAAGRGTTGP